MSVMKKLLGAVGLGGETASAVSPPRPSSAYMRGGRHVTFAGWRPPLREPQVDIREAWDGAAARVVDAIHNSGWLSGAIEQAVANTVGSGLRLKVSPESRLFGMSGADARAWGRVVEARFGLWADRKEECDIQGLRTHGEMQAAAFKTWLGMGEILASLPYKKHSWGTSGTKVRLLMPSRLKRKTSNLERLVDGVYTDRDGMPLAYLTTRKNDFQYEEEFVVRARDAMGRPNVIHIFTGLPETHRGISPMVPGLQLTRQFDQLADATLTASLLQTLFAATITGDAPTDETIEGLMAPQEFAKFKASGGSTMEAFMMATGAYYDGTTFDTSINGRVAHLFPGQSLKFETAQTPGIAYEAFTKTILRELSRCLGMLYESATGDYTGATYASLNAGTAEIHKVTLARRKAILVPFCQATYEAWLEEEIFDGRISFPGGYQAFLANRAAACRAEWFGSPRSQGDDLKLAKAHEVWKRLGVISDQMIANDLGVDIEDVYEQRAREAELREEYGLPEAVLTVAQPDAPDQGDEPDPDAPIQQ
jgi:lambda family phage portal protein